MLADAVRLINASHSGQDFFEPVTLDSLTSRLNRDAQYTSGHIFGARDGDALVAVAGLCDKGAATERTHVDPATGAATRTREAVVVDWGWAPGHEAAFAGLLRSLAVRARSLGRDVLTICEPSAGVVPVPGLPAQRSPAALFTPAMDPPGAGSIVGVYFDLLFL
jgi:hypothetical protein